MSAVTPTLSVGSFTREAFTAHLERVKHLPSWWLDRKRAAYERFVAAPIPKGDQSIRQQRHSTILVSFMTATVHTER